MKMVEFKKIHKYKIAVIFVLTGLLLSNLKVHSLQNDYLNNLIQDAISKSPKIATLNYKWEAAKNRIPQNSNLPDPMISLGLMSLPVNSFAFTQEPMTGKVISLSQAFPFPGKLSSIEAFTAVDTAIIRQEILEAENEIKNNVIQIYYELSFVRIGLGIAYKNKELLRQISEVVNTKYSVSMASQQNVLKVSLELTNLNDHISDLHNKINSLLAQLNALLYKPEDSQIDSIGLPKLNYLHLSSDSLKSLAMMLRPLLKSLLLAEKKSSLMADAAEYDYLPNFNVMAQYSQRDFIASSSMPLTDFLSFNIGISLPLNYGGKVTAKVQEARAMQSLYLQQYEYILQSLEGSFGSILSRLSSLEERIELINEGLLPQAKQTMSATLASYQVGQVDFINVIDVQKMLFDIETKYYRLSADYLKEISTLEYLTGKLQIN